MRAARAQATVGETSCALEKVFGRHKADQELATGIYARTYGAKKPSIVAVRDKVEQFLNHYGHKPRIFICKLGQDGHDRGQEVVGAALSDLGFDVVVDPLFQTPQEAARQAIEEHVDIVGPSTLAVPKESSSLWPAFCTAKETNRGRNEPKPATRENGRRVDAHSEGGRPDGDDDQCRPDRTARGDPC